MLQRSSKAVLGAQSSGEPTPGSLAVHLLGMLDGSIQGAEEGATFLHQAVEVHFMEEVTLGIAEVLCAKPVRTRKHIDL